MNPVKPKVMAAGIGGTFTAALMGIIVAFYPGMTIPPGLEGLIAAAIGFMLAWVKKE